MYFTKIKNIIIIYTLLKELILEIHIETFFIEN
jgi:hypothetical protein